MCIAHCCLLTPTVEASSLHSAVRKRLATSIHEDACLHLKDHISNLFQYFTGILIYDDVTIIMIQHNRNTHNNMPVYSSSYFAPCYLLRKYEKKSTPTIGIVVKL